MKLIFEEEDCILGIIAGVLIIGFSGKYFSVPKLPFVWGAFFVICFIFTLLDVAHTFADMSYHPGLIVVFLANNAADAAVELGFFAKFFSINFPYITPYVVPFLEAHTFLVGAFFFISSAIWLVTLPIIK